MGSVRFRAQRLLDAAHLYMCTQHEHLDACGLPWEIDPDIGTIIAKAPTCRSEGDRGEGAYVFRWTETGVIVVPSTTPGRGAQVIADRDRTRERQKAEGDAAVAEWVAEREAAFECERGDEGVEEEEEQTECPPDMPMPERKRSKPARSRGSKNDPDDDIRQTLRVERHPRPDGSRSDLAIFTPDGVRHRSFASAIRYVRENAE